MEARLSPTGFVKMLACSGPDSALLNMTTVLLMGRREKHEEKSPWEDTDTQGKDSGDRGRAWSDAAERREPWKAIDTW